MKQSYTDHLGQTFPSLSAIEDVEYDTFDCDYLIQTTDAPHIIYLDDIQNYLDFL